MKKSLKNQRGYNCSCILPVIIAVIVAATMLFTAGLCAKSALDIAHKTYTTEVVVTNPSNVETKK